MIMSALFTANTANAWMSFKGFVYCDANSNDIVDPADTPLPGVVIKLENQAGSWSANGTTLDNGSLFIQLNGEEVTTYHVALDEATLPSDFAYVAPADGKYEFTTFTPWYGYWDNQWLISSATCIVSSCGNGQIDGGEECDDGNNLNGDGCAANCTVEPRCGDGILDFGEGCDDGNNVDGDGCSAACTIESFCGDGVLDVGESCDDGNNMGGDGCSANCAIEPYCGNGVLDPGETCDDGNNINGDGCSSTCEHERGTQGCTPGYFKQQQHFGSYAAPFGPNTLFSAVFENAFPGKTFLQVLSLGGGGLNALGRHTVAAFLNASSHDVNYDFDAAQVVMMFNAVYPGTKAQYEFIKNQFNFLNEMGCPLGRAE